MDRIVALPRSVIMPQQFAAKLVGAVRDRIRFVRVEQRAVRGDVGVVETGLARSLAHIDIDDLLRLADLAAEAEAGLFARRPQGAGRYAGRLICRVLCQGAALHYLDDRTGVKDFDIWSFYAAHGDGPFPYRWRGTADYGPSKFGRYPGDPSSFTGRRVDMLGRSLNVPPGAEPVTAVRDYLLAGRTRSARELAAKAVVLISPGQLAGKVVWPHTGSPH